MLMLLMPENFGNGYQSIGHRLLFHFRWITQSLLLVLMLLTLQEAAAQEYQDGVAAFNEHDYQEAITVFNQLLQQCCSFGGEVGGNG